jgi:hypothetical protein
MFKTSVRSFLSVFVNTDPESDFVVLGKARIPAESLTTIQIHLSCSRD